MYLGKLKEPPCDKCYVDLALDNFDVMRFYRLVCNQVRVSQSEVIGLDYDAVISVLELYLKPDEIKGMLEWLIECFRIEQEYTKE